jgi:hypothetical protein
MYNKEIHFYKDIVSIPEGWVYHTHNETMEVVKLNKSIIYTTAISALDFAYLLDCRYDIYLHENNKSFQIKEGNVVATDKEIRKAHDIRKLWIGGGFNNFFYGE